MLPIGSRCLLLIDEDLIGRRRTAALARRSGWRVITAGDVQAASAALSSELNGDVDVILLDHPFLEPDSEVSQA